MSPSITCMSFNFNDSSVDKPRPRPLAFLFKTNTAIVAQPPVLHIRGEFRAVIVDWAKVIDNPFTIWLGYEFKRKGVDLKKHLASLGYSRTRRSEPDLLDIWNNYKDMGRVEHPRNFREPDFESGCRQIAGKVEELMKVREASEITVDASSSTLVPTRCCGWRVLPSPQSPRL